MFSAIRFIPWAFEAGSLIEMKTRGYSIRARGDQSLTNRPDIWEQLRSPTAAMEEKNARKSGGVQVCYKVAGMCGFHHGLMCSLRSHYARCIVIRRVQIKMLPDIPPLKNEETDRARRPRSGPEDIQRRAGPPGRQGRDL